MYSAFQLGKKYLHYYFTASNGKGHGTHSPFVFNFITHVLADKRQYGDYEKIEKIRAALKKDNTIIEVEDLGAGSAVIQSDKRMVKAIAGSSLKPRKYAQLLYRMVLYYSPETILELGTSFGITTAYLASGNPLAKVYTCEGAANIAGIAKNTFRQLSITNVELLQGDFTATMQRLFSDSIKIDFAFVDGNHRKTPTLQYFEELLIHSRNNSILVFDDIHWSKEMEGAWSIIQLHAKVTLTIDLFFIGIIFINNDIKVKQHFTIAY